MLEVLNIRCSILHWHLLSGVLKGYFNFKDFLRSQWKFSEVKGHERREEESKRASSEDGDLTLQEGESITRVMSLRGSNLIEVMDAQGEKLLALFPAKFQKSMWIKRGNFVVVDESGKHKALESGSKVACIVSRVLFYEQVRVLQKSPEWPEIFKSTSLNAVNANSQRLTSQSEDSELYYSDDDGLPPVEANMNRIRPSELQPDAHDSGSDTDS